MRASALQIGLRHSYGVVVDAGLTVPEVSPAFVSFRGMPPVFATAYMVGLIEAACVEALQPYLDEDQRTVGTHIDIGHSAPTPVGMTVTAEVELVAIDGRRLRFKVECRDDVEVIGAGYHERFIIDSPKFLARVQAKGQSAGV